jgi:hypothetical protein
MLTLVLDDQPWSPGEASARVINQWRDEGRTFAVAMTDGRRRWLDWSGVGTFLFDDHSSEVRLHRSTGVDAAHATAVFACVVQPLILQARGLPVLHASAAAGPEGVIAFCGLSGSGKSTIAYALGREPGFTQIADDAHVLRETPPDGFAVECLPFRSRLRAPSARFFRTPTIAVTTGAANRAGTLPLRAVVALSPSARPEPDARPVMTTVPSRTAFSLLLTHAHCFDEANRRAMSQLVQTYLAMADVVPVFRLTFRPDFEAMPALLSTVVEAVAARRPALG